MSVQKRNILGESICSPGTGDGADPSVPPKYDPQTDNPVAGYKAPTPSPRLRASEGYDGATEDRMGQRESEFRTAQRAAYGEANGITQDTSGAGYPIGGE
jgi:hypothetical protein